MTKAKKSKKKSNLVTIKTPRQARFKGMEDPAIMEIERAAEDHAELRDKRVGLGEEILQSKDHILRLMEKNGKTSYNHAGVKIKVSASKKGVSIQVHKEKKKDS